jgi:hypothetical protein
LDRFDTSAGWHHNDGQPTEAATMFDKLKADDESWGENSELE